MWVLCQSWQGPRVLTQCKDWNRNKVLFLAPVSSGHMGNLIGKEKYRHARRKAGSTVPARLEGSGAGRWKGRVGFIWRGASCGGRFLALPLVWFIRDALGQTHSAKRWWGCRRKTASQITEPFYVPNSPILLCMNANIIIGHMCGLYFY